MEKGCAETYIPAGRLVEEIERRTKNPQTPAPLLRERLLYTILRYSIPKTQDSILQPHTDLLGEEKKAIVDRQQ